GERIELVHHRVDGVLQLEDLAFDVHGDLARQVTVRDCGGDVGDVAHLSGEVRGHRVDGVGQVLPGPGHARDLGLSAELAFGPDLARHPAHLGGKPVELIHHRVDGVLELQDLAFDVDGNFARQVATRDGRGHVGDVAHLPGEVRRHGVHRVGQVLPGPGDAGYFGLSAQLALRPDLPRDATDFRGERVELVHHGVDGVLELENFAFDVHGDLAGQAAARDGCRHVGDLAYLPGEVGRHEVDVVGEVLPRAGDARHDGLAAQLAVGANFAGHPRDLGRERA